MTVLFVITGIHSILHERLNGHYKAWSYKEKNKTKITSISES